MLQGFAKGSVFFVLWRWSIGSERQNSGRDHSQPQHASQFQSVLVMLLSGQSNALIHYLLIRSTQKSDQSIDDSVHMSNLISLEISQAGRRGLIFGLSSNPLQVSDGIPELFLGATGSQGRGIIKFTHMDVNFLNLRLDIFRCTRIRSGSVSDNGCSRWQGCIQLMTGHCRVRKMQATRVRQLDTREEKMFFSSDKVPKNRGTAPGCSSIIV